eukprot:GCRY01000451.1.p1 GENE.GCRY01000451.1~~GCRY01000451.1.p1  ORF type:complete len:320 (+),score=76.19 GCRY01000451.1:125-1084(+)
MSNVIEKYSALLQEAVTKLDKEDYDGAFKAFESGAELLEKEEMYEEAADAHLQVIEVLVKTNHMDEAVKYSEKVVATANKSKNPEICVGAHSALGQAFYDFENTTEAIRHYSLALDHLKNIDEEDTIVHTGLTLMALSNCYVQANEIEKAKDIHTKLTEMGKHLELPIFECMSLSGQVMIHLKDEKKEEAVKILEEMEKKGRESEDKDCVVFALTHISQHYQELGNEEKATEYETMAEEEQEKIAVARCDVCENDIFVNQHFYHCQVCEDYDLCHECFSEGKVSKDHVSTHEMQETVQSGSCCGHDGCMSEEEEEDEEN